MWDLLWATGADLILNGHEHNYERFLPQDPTGRAVADGIVEIVAGTGGNDDGSYPFGEPIANSAVRLNGLGVVRLRLWGRGWAEGSSGRVARSRTVPQAPAETRTSASMDAVEGRTPWPAIRV